MNSPSRVFLRPSSLSQIFAQNNIKTFDDLASDSMRIERLLSKKAPFGAHVREGTLLVKEETNETRR